MISTCVLASIGEQRARSAVEMSNIGTFDNAARRRVQESQWLKAAGSRVTHATKENAHAT
jgi:hypothetical protein